jgi:hypothetical protein
MSKDETIEILNTIGQHIADIVGAHPNDTFLYVEADSGSRDAGIFQDIGEKVIYHDPTEDLFDDIGRLWEMAESDKKWAVMQYDVKEGKFDAQFTFPEDISSDDSIHDRREHALAMRYGEKPVIYPEPADWFHDLTEDDLTDT